MNAAQLSQNFRNNPEKYGPATKMEKYDFYSLSMKAKQEYVKVLALADEMVGDGIDEFDAALRIRDTANNATEHEKQAIDLYVFEVAARKYYKA